MPKPSQLTVIIPVYNRPELLRYSLSSVRVASVGLSVEVIVVDDGSTDAPDRVIAEFSDLSIRTLKQENGGSIPARLNGFRASTGTYVQFLDSDDMVAPEKFRQQLAVLEQSDADAVYSDAASVTLDRPYVELSPEPASPFPSVTELCDFCFRVQPNPHAAIYRRTLLDRALSPPLIPPNRRFDPVGDVWVYYNLCVLSARVLRTPGPWAIVGRHSDVRYSRHWENLGEAAFHLMVDFDQRCPRTSQTEYARQSFGEKCFATWRALPRGFDEELEEKLLAMWRASPAARSRQLGGRWFQLAASILGAERAARAFRRWQRPRYETIASLAPTAAESVPPTKPSPDVKL